MSIYVEREGEYICRERVSIYVERGDEYRISSTSFRPRIVSAQFASASDLVLALD